MAAIDYCSTPTRNSHLANGGVSMYGLRHAEAQQTAKPSSIGVGKALASPPSEPCRRFSRTRLSSQWLLHRDWLASAWARSIMKSPCAAKKAISLSPAWTPLSSAANIRLDHPAASTQHPLRFRASVSRLAVSSTGETPSLFARVTRCVPHVSTFLPPFPGRGLCCPALFA